MAARGNWVEQLERLGGAAALRLGLTWAVTSHGPQTCPHNQLTVQQA